MGFHPMTTTSLPSWFLPRFPLRILPRFLPRFPLRFIPRFLPRFLPRLLSQCCWMSLALACLALPARALDYVDSSPSGAQFPQWDGGDTGLCFADIDSDGNVDLLSIGDHGSPYINTDQHGIMVYFGDGAGGWSIHMEGNFGYGGIAVGDVNNDGLLDVGYGMHHDCER